MTNSLLNINILILDDEALVLNELTEYLKDQTYSIMSAEKPSEAFNILENNKIDIAIVDVNLPEMSGLDVLKKIREQFQDVEVIMISGYSETDVVIKAMRLGAFDFFNKPFRLSELSKTIERTKRFVKLSMSLKEAKRNFSIISSEFKKHLGYELIGESQHMKNLMVLIAKVAKTDNTSVLIIGESGTGKELVARAIHQLSSRKEKCFYGVNCSAIPESLFESEFFGHTKGAFTGADAAKEGWFETANNGSLFLDEIGDMHVNLQIKFLRVLEERKIRKLGSNIEVPFDTRIIAATNQDLARMSENKQFRLDLFHRLSSFVIYLDPLRERKEDIPLLVKHFVEYFNSMMGKNISKIENNAIQTLLNYNFPGNIRELKNMVERAVILCEGDELLDSHFMQNTGLATNMSLDIENKEFNLKILERKAILSALKLSNNNKAKAAKLLGITWQSLDRRLKKNDIVS